MRQGIRRGVLVVAALSVVSSGCASVEWTEGILAKRQVEVDGRLARVETDVRQQGQRIDQVEVRVAQLDDRLTETRELVRSGAPAPAAVRSSPPGAVESPTAPRRVPRAARTLVTVVHVPFGFDRADLDPAATAALAPLLEEMRRNIGMTIDLEGSTDTVGSVDYNLRLSQRRVEAVRRWLLGHGIERSRIVASTARGPLAGAAVKDDSKRRGMVKLMSSSEGSPRNSRLGGGRPRRRSPHSLRRRLRPRRCCGTIARARVRVAGGGACGSPGYWAEQFLSSPC